MSVNPSGSSNSVSLFPWNAAVPIVVTLSGILTDVSPLSLNALFPIATTSSPSIVSGIITSVAVPMYLVIVPSENSKSGSRPGSGSKASIALLISSITSFTSSKVAFGLAFTVSPASMAACNAAMLSSVFPSISAPSAFSSTSVNAA